MRFPFGEKRKLKIPTKTRKTVTVAVLPTCDANKDAPIAVGAKAKIERIKRNGCGLRQKRSLKENDSLAHKNKI